LNYPVTVGGDWIGSSIAAGVIDGGDGFGNPNDVTMSGPCITDEPTRHSIIGSIRIKGEAFGTPNSVNVLDHFGFVAREIRSVWIGGKTFPLTAGKSNDQLLVGLPVGPIDDFRVLEVA